ncbi:hypothetical protein K435DRAFT_761674 [Dendrothele bispora CBS 962.96]|uniref:Uncharacterized protein n=1 Tax=Dendrothele bispora (strain CBS 962.96) TaxID=1314807 RepID=A0A4S8LI32_DENBC|nr:hypothetical protein K435DRAFT_761674 [Dendrothele bispora CBS 962.96]
MSSRTSMVKLSIAVLTAFLSFSLTYFSPFKRYISNTFSIKTQTQASPIPITTRTLSTNCTSPPPHSCTFYAACLEPVFHCGPSGYPIGFGEEFCTKFSLPSNVGRLSPQGQQWMYTTMHCLQEALVPTLEKEASLGPELAGDDQNACDRLEKEAFGTHAPCYLSSGLCTLTPKDWIVIVEIVQLKTLFGSWDAFEGSVEAAEGCVEFYAWVLEHRVTA